jgi:hypothetical protein
MSFGDLVWFVFAAICIWGVATDWQFKRGKQAGLKLIGMIGAFLIPLSVIALITYLYYL